MSPTQGTMTWSKATIKFATSLL